MEHYHLNNQITDLWNRFNDSFDNYHKEVMNRVPSYLSIPKSKDKILFIEDIGEHYYSIDRMMTQLQRSGKLDKIKGLIVGGFTEMKDTERPFGKTIQEIIFDIVKEFDYPVCFGFPISHGNINLSVKIGCAYQLNITKSKTNLKEI